MTADSEITAVWQHGAKRRRRSLIAAQGCRNPGTTRNKERKNAESVGELPAGPLANAFSVQNDPFVETQGCRYAPTAGLKLVNAFGVQVKNPTLYLNLDGQAETKSVR
jgi:hypothetical protein